MRESEEREGVLVNLFDGNQIQTVVKKRKLGARR